MFELQPSHTLIFAADTFEQLDEYVSHFSNVKVLRQDARKGLIRARLAGAAYSQGKVLSYYNTITIYHFRVVLFYTIFLNCDQS